MSPKLLVSLVHSLTMISTLLLASFFATAAQAGKRGLDWTFCMFWHLSKWIDPWSISWKRRQCSVVSPLLARSSSDPNCSAFFIRDTSVFKSDNVRWWYFIQARTLIPHYRLLLCEQVLVILSQYCKRSADMTTRHMHHHPRAGLAILTSSVCRVQKTVPLAL